MSMLSIVTVCYNEEKDIKRTIESVLQQDTTDFEYIICDGLSKDRTVEIAESYKNKFKEKGISYSIYSEKDGGVYFGMNNGIERANGRYIWFLNAGDWLCDSNALNRMMALASEKEFPDVVYGDYFVVDKNIPILNHSMHAHLKKEMSIGHPASMVLASVMRENKFNTKYRIAADYNLFLGLFLKEKRFEHLESAVSYFPVGGISTVNIKESLEEANSVRLSYGIASEIPEIKEKSSKDKIYETLKNSLPGWLWKFWNVNIKKRDWVEM